MDLIAIFLIAQAGLNTGVVENRVGAVAPTIEKLSPSLVTYINDELKSEFYAMSDIDPKAFDFKPDEDEKNADFATINFLSKLLYASNENPIAYTEKHLLDPDSDYETDEMEYIPAKPSSYRKIALIEKPIPISKIIATGPVIPSRTERRNNVPTANSPQQFVKDEGFYIDRRPVTNREYRRFVQATGFAPPSHWPDGDVTNSLKDLPVVNVTYNDARAYAEWIGHRLPTKEEFDKALEYAPMIRLASPIMEWTDTKENPGAQDSKIVLVGGEPVAPTFVSPQTGFRTVLDDKQ